MAFGVVYLVRLHKRRRSMRCALPIFVEVWIKLLKSYDIWPALLTNAVALRERSIRDGAVLFLPDLASASSTVRLPHAFAFPSPRSEPVKPWNENIPSPC